MPEEFEGQGLEDQGTAEVQEEGQVDASVGDDDSLASSFLSGIEDETQRKLLEPHVKEWDSQVTKKFQSIHDQYKPYKEIGLQEDQLQQAARLYDMMLNQPDIVYQRLHQMYSNQQGQGQQQQQQQQKPPQPKQQQQNQELEFDENDPYGDKFQKYDSRFQTLEQQLLKIAKAITNQQKSQQEAYEDYQLEQYLNQLKETKGDFDVEYVLTQMQNGLSGEDAVDKFHKLIESRTQQQGQKNQSAPRVLTGNGQPSSSSKFDPKAASEKELTSMIAGLIQNANQA